jgi:nucleoside-diphosphate-sugar epimerase
MRILVTGSSGFIGRHLCERLQLEGHEVVSYKRGNGCDFNQMTTVDSWRDYLLDIDVVINCVGIISESRNQRFDTLHTDAPIALFKACEERGIKRVIQISALGVNDDAFTPYQLSKKAADDYLRQAHDGPSSLKYFVLQPSLIYGDGGSSFKLFRNLARLPLIAVPGKGEAMIQPVHISDVIEAIINCLDVEPTCQTISLVGPKALSYRDWLQAIRQSMGLKPAMIMPMPYRLLLPLAKLIAPIFPTLSPDNLKMLRAGSVDDVEVFQQLIGRSPQTIEEGLKR